MKPKMTKAEACAWRERWRLVNQAEIQEIRATSFETRFRQLAAMMQTAITLGWASSKPEEIDSIRQRWIRLKSSAHDPR